MDIVDSVPNEKVWTSFHASWHHVRVRRLNMYFLSISANYIRTILYMLPENFFIITFFGVVFILYRYMYTLPGLSSHLKKSILLCSCALRYFEKGDNNKIVFAQRAEREDGNRSRRALPGQGRLHLMCHLQAKMRLYPSLYDPSLSDTSLNNSSLNDSSPNQILVESNSFKVQHLRESRTGD